MGTLVVIIVIILIIVIGWISELMERPGANKVRRVRQYDPCKYESWEEAEKANDIREFVCHHLCETGDIVCRDFYNCKIM